jgi:hypothetical protein
MRCRVAAQTSRVVGRQVRRQTDTMPFAPFTNRCGNAAGRTGSRWNPRSSRPSAPCAGRCRRQQHAGEASRVSVAGRRRSRDCRGCRGVSSGQVGERLCEAGECVGDRLVAVRVEQRHRVADHAGGLHERPVGEQTLDVHVPQDPAVHRLEPVGGRRDGSVLDDLLAWRSSAVGCSTRGDRRCLSNSARDHPARLRPSWPSVAPSVPGPCGDPSSSGGPDGSGTRPSGAPGSRRCARGTRPCGPRLGPNNRSVSRRAGWVVDHRARSCG